MRKPVLLCDVDGVVADLTQHILDIVQACFGVTYTPEHITQYWVEKALHLTELQTKEMYERLDVAGTAMALRPYPKAISALKRLQKKTELVFLTSHLKSNATWVYDRDRWIESYFRKPPPVIHTHHKEFVPGDIFVDDKYENISAWKKAWPDGIAVLWDRPWNHREICSPRNENEFIRYSDWEEVEKLVDLIAREKIRV